MMRSIYAVLLAILVLSAVGITRQQPTYQGRPLPDGPEENITDEREKRVPPFDYCKRSDVTITPRETHAHHCDCTVTCSIGPGGEVIEQENEKCLTYCHKNGRHCTCHTEEPCPIGPGQGLLDMDGNLVAVGL